MYMYVLIVDYVGLEEEGLYRRPGVLAKANKLMKEVSGEE